MTSNPDSNNILARRNAYDAAHDRLYRLIHDRLAQEHGEGVLPEALADALERAAAAFKEACTEQAE